MHSWLYFTFAVIFFHKNKCSYVFSNNKMNQISNNIEMFVKPIKKISGIFPNHEFELQFDLEQVDDDRPRLITYRRPSHAIMRSENESKMTNNVNSVTNDDESKEFSTTSTKNYATETTTKPSFGAASVQTDTTPDPNNQVVYMKDLKNALEEYEKKHKEDCIKKELTAESPNLLSGLDDNPPLSDVLQLIKRGAKLQNDIPKPGDPDFSWIKIRVPTA